MLANFFCAYYSFLQKNKELAEFLSIVHTEEDIVDVCKFVSDRNNFKNNLTVEQFYIKLDNSLPSNKISEQTINFSKTKSVFPDQTKLYEREVSKPKRIAT